MRYLKQTLIMALCAVVFLSCQDDNGVNPADNPYLEPGDEIGSDIGVSITDAYFVLSTSHIGNLANDNSDLYYYGFWTVFQLSDSAKCELIDSISITLSDAASQVIRDKFKVNQYSFSYSGSTPMLSCYFMYNSLPNMLDLNFTSPQYVCKARLYNSLNDSTKVYQFIIKTENYIKPEAFPCQWVNASDIKISISGMTSLHSYYNAVVNYYSKDYEYLSSMSTEISAGQNSIYAVNVPNDAAYYRINLNDKYSGIERRFQGKMNPLPERDLGPTINLGDVIIDLSSVEYIESWNKLALISSKNMGIVLIDAETYETVWAETIYENPNACKFDKNENKIYVGGSIGNIYSFDPISGSQTVLTRLDFPIDFLDVEGNYIIAFSRSGRFAIYNYKNGSIKKGSFNNNPFLRMSNFNYNKTSGNIYIVSDLTLYSFKFDLETGNYSFINSDIMRKRTGDWGGPALIFNSNEDKLYTGFGLIYTCSPDSANDLVYTGKNVSPLDDIFPTPNKNFNISISKRYYSTPPNISIIDNLDYILNSRTNIAGVPIKAFNDGDSVKVFMTLPDGSLAVQKFSISDISVH